MPSATALHFMQLGHTHVAQCTIAICPSGHRNRSCDVANVLQAGAWDVDDTGLEYMPNKDVAERIQKKVLSMYIRDSVVSTGLLAAFCFWPL